MKQITKYINEILAPEMYDNINVLFPDMEFKRYGSRWQTPRKLDGTKSKKTRPDKCVITKRCFKRILENGGETKDLITYYAERNGLSSDIEAIKAISDILGLSLPTIENAESLRAYREKKEGLEAAAERMKAALRTKEGKAVLDYLKYTRGYRVDYIEAASFGYCSEAEAETLKPLLTYIDAEGREHGLPTGIGRSHILAIPYRTGGDLIGFKFRTIDNNTQPKYKDAFTGYRASQKYHFFGLSGLRYGGSEESSRDLTIVEGELDALRAAYEMDNINVAAAAGGEIYPEALAEAKARGVKRITLLYDKEETEEKQAATEKKIKKAIRTIYEAGLYPLVARFPEAEGMKLDADTFLKIYEGEALEEIIEDAEAGVSYLYRNLAKSVLLNAVDNIGQTGDNKAVRDRTVNEIKRQTIELANLPYILPTDRDLIFKDFAESMSSGITPEALEAEADRMRTAEAEKEQKASLLTTISEARRIATSEEPEAIKEALEYLGGKLEPLKAISREARFSALLELPTEKAIKEDYTERPSGIPTEYLFGYDEDQERLQLQAGALTYVCAPTSHGKSRFLENLALQVATESTERAEGSVLYFSFEEDKTAVKLQLLNIFLNATLSHNNMRSLTSYYKNETNYFTKDNINILKAKEPEFNKLLTSGKLRVYSENLDSSGLVEAIRYLNKNINVRAVFIDYIQLLHTTGCKTGRKEELADMCRELMAAAKDTGLPIVIAAQLNREALSPIEMAAQNIAEASEIEHSANTIILLWNSSSKPLAKSNYYYKNGAKRELSEEGQRLEDNGFKIGERGKMYAILAKNRGGLRNLENILDFNGNTGKITQITEPTQENELPF